MFANRFTVVADACVLVPPLVRNLLLSLAEAELFRLRWSERIMDEFERGFARDVLRHRREGLCCTNGVTDGVPLSPDGLTPRPL